MTDVATKPEVKTEKAEFWADFAFTKAAKAKSGELELVGYASTWVKDRDGERIDPHAYDKTLEGYLNKNAIVLYQHDHDKPFGHTEEGEVDDGGLLVRSLIPPPGDNEEPWAHTAYAKTDAGILKTFSVGGHFIRELRPPADADLWDTDLLDIVITEVDLFEISVVSVPANPDSIFEASRKAFKSGAAEALATDRRGLMLAQVEQLLGIKELTNPDLITMSADDRKRRFEQLTKALELEVEYEAYRDAEKAVADDPIKAAKLATAVVGKLYVPPSAAVKAGKVLSKANEDRLKAARDAIDEVLSQTDTPTKEEE